MAILAGDWPIDASTTSGNDLADKLNRLASGALTAVGGVLTGPLTLAADPAAAMQAATKQYADAKAATVQAGVDQAKADAAAAATAATAASNSAAGKLPLTGGTLTGSLTITNGALVINTWTITDEGAGIVFRHGGAVKLVIRLDGSIEVPGNITAYANV
jgi:hypothetical protein